MSNPNAPGPGYWMNETGGHVKAAIVRYLDGKPLSLEDVFWIRQYLRQWVNAEVWDTNPHGTAGLSELRKSVVTVIDRRSLSEWLHRATDAGMDPL